MYDVAPIDLEVFFEHIRQAKVFGPELSTTEVKGCESILSAWARLGWPSDLRHVAYTMATAYHEARLIANIREVGRGAGKRYGLPAGPYGKVYYGRSYCQLTWLENYEKFGKLLDIDLVKDPDLTLDPIIGAEVLIVGSRDGLFRANKSLKRYFSATTDDPVNARDIINGDVKSHGLLVAGYHSLILKALVFGAQAYAVNVKPAIAASVIVAPTPVPAIPAPATPMSAPQPSIPQASATVVQPAAHKPPLVPNSSVAPSVASRGGFFASLGAALREKFPRKDSTNG